MYSFRNVIMQKHVWSDNNQMWTLGAGESESLFDCSSSSKISQLKTNFDLKATKWYHNQLIFLLHNIQDVIRKVMKWIPAALKVNVASGMHQSRSWPLALEPSCSFFRVITDAHILIILRKNFLLLLCLLACLLYYSEKPPCSSSMSWCRWFVLTFCCKTPECLL